MRVGVTIALLLLAVPAQAQRLVPVSDQAEALFLGSPPFPDAGSLFAYCLDGQTPVLLHADANTVQRVALLPPLSPPTVEAVACGGRRWLLDYDVKRNRFAVRPDVGTEV